jgi:DNA-binding MarR family transcriptional regulator
MPRKSKPATPPEEIGAEAAVLPDLGCACANIRRAARLVTQLYDHEMGGGIEPAQFSLLTMLSRRPGSSQAPMGRTLGLDKTTLSRNLTLMKKNGWIEHAKSEDHRERGYRLTMAGEKLLSATRPAWRRAQEKLRASLGPGEWETMQAMLARVARAATEARARST